MHCDKEQIIIWLNGQMSDDDRRKFESHLSLCEHCREELNTSRRVFELMNEIDTPEPSINVRARFHGMLDAYKRSQEEKTDFLYNIINRLEQTWKMQPKLQLSYAVILLLTGLMFGYALNRPDAGNSKDQISHLNSQIDEMRQVIMLAMVENPSASKRLQAVSYSNELNQLDDKVVNVLLKTLNEDPNVNVRLATLEALLKFSHSPKVRKGLVESITLQESPLVISALADAMVEMQEKSSVDLFKQLLNKDDLNSSVKSKIEKSIYLLI